MNELISPGRHRSVLVVEDDAVRLDALTFALRAAGWDVASATTLRNATQAVDATRPDLVIAETTLPDGSTLDLCRELTRETLDRLTPVILTSPLFDRDWARRTALEAGAWALLRQPLDADEAVTQAELLHRVFAVARAAPRRLALVAHDLRVPLHAITVSASSLASAPLDAHDARAAAVIRQSTARMSELVGALLDYSAIALGAGLPVRKAKVDLARLCAELVAEASAGAPGRIALTAPATCVTRCDRGRMAQVLANLLANALQHGAPGGKVAVTLSCSAAQSVIVVENRGVHIPPERMPELFKPFQRGDSAAPGLGFGLGLFIARELAEAHGGRVEGESSPEGVIRFTVTLPAPAPEDASGRR